MATYIAMAACAVVFTVIGALAIREVRKPAEVATCLHGVPSPCGICGEFIEGRQQRSELTAIANVG